MIWFKNLKIQRKLFLVFGSIVALVAIIAITTVSIVNYIQKEHEMLTEGCIKRLLYASDAAREMTNIRRYILSMEFWVDDNEIIKSYYSEFELSAAIFTEYLSNYTANLENDSSVTPLVKETNLNVVTKMTDLFNTVYRQYVSDMYIAALEGDKAEMNRLIEMRISLGDQITGELDDLRFQAEKGAKDANDKIHALSVRLVKIVFGIAIGIAIIAVLISMFMSKAVNKPIISMQSAMAEIAKGNLKYPIRSPYKDELGVLSNRIGDMVDTISELNKAVSIVDNVDDMICVTDLNFNLIFANYKLADMFGLDKDNSLGQKCYQVIRGLSEPCRLCPLHQLLLKKEQFPSLEWEYSWDEKLGIWVSGKASIIRWIDGSMAHIYIVKDDTLRKEHEEQRKRYEEELRQAALTAEEMSRTKSAFLANMSHEIRTPMNSIIGFSELALSDDIPLKTKDYLGKIKNSAYGLLQIINDILDISKIESGKIELESIPFNLHDVFNLCRTLIEPKAMEKGIALYCYAEPSIGKKLLGDPTRLQQVLINLLSNAVKFTHVGLVKLLSSIEQVAGDDVTIHFEVKDSGIGMTPGQIQRIFETFMQADSSTTRKYGGSGLGLAITKNIIELMGGELKVESAPGLGSKFSFDLTLKAIDVTVNDSISETVINVIEKPVFNGVVLVCEDNSMNQQVIREHLSRVGLKAVIADNGKECVDIVRRRIEGNDQPFDIIFMDIHMPKMDGLEAADNLSQIGNKTPIVAMTANVMSNDREIYRMHGMLDCLAKPYTTQELWGCLLKYITPVSMKATDENEQTAAEADAKLRNQLLADFARDNQTTFKDISDAIANGDIKLAHRLAHTLKGVAGLIGKTALQAYAYDVEQSLADGKTGYIKEQMNSLEFELNEVLRDLAPLLPKHKSKKEVIGPIDKEKMLELVEKLEPLLKAGNTECLKLIDNLRSIPGTDVLIEQMEDFDFSPALDTLTGIKQRLEA